MNRIKNKLLTQILFLNSLTIFAQKDLSAKIEIDDNLNLNVSQSLNKNKKEIYRFPKNISLENSSAKLLDTQPNFKKYEIEGLDKINYSLKMDVEKKRLYKNNNYFVYTSRYLGFNSDNFTKEKRINVDITSKKFNVIFPTTEDLERKYISSPIIIAGNFKTFESNGFKVYYLEENNDIIENIKKAAESLQKSYEFYSNYFGKKEKPKIVFIPFEGKSETNEGVIVYNINSLKGFHTTISHEVAHIWFGNDGIIFSEKPVTESFAEFMALQYLIATYNSDNFKKLFDDLMQRKLLRIEGRKSFSDIKNKNLDSDENEILSYNLLPLYLFTKQKNDNNFINIVSDFYKSKKDFHSSSLDEFNFFLQSKGIETIFSEDLPEFFIQNCDNSKICIRSNSDKNYDLELELTYLDGKKERKVIKISRKNPQFLEEKSYKRILLDPDFKILQTSRFNDIWNSDGDNLFEKNRYYDFTKLKPELQVFSNEIANYFSNSDNNISKYIVISDEQKKIFTEIKNKFFSPKILITGASSTFDDKKNILFLNFAFYDDLTRELKILKTKLGLNIENSKVESFSTYE